MTASTKRPTQRDLLLQRAVACYERAGWTDEACRVLEALGDLRRAARGHELQGQYARAAELYARAGSWPDAARCALRAGDDAAAATALEQAGDALAAAWVLVERCRRVARAEAVLAGAKAPELEIPEPLALRALVECGLLDELATLYSQESAAYLLAERVGFSRARLPVFRDPRQFWAGVCRSIEAGAVRSGSLSLLLEAAARDFPQNPRLRLWATRATPAPAAGRGAADAATGGATGVDRVAWRLEADLVRARCALARRRSGDAAELLARVVASVDGLPPGGAPLDDPQEEALAVLAARGNRTRPFFAASDPRRRRVEAWAFVLVERLARPDLGALLHAAAVRAGVAGAAARWRRWAEAVLGDARGVPEDEGEAVVPVLDRAEGRGPCDVLVPLPGRDELWSSDDPGFPEQGLEVVLRRLGCTRDEAGRRVADAQEREAPVVRGVTRDVAERCSEELRRFGLSPEVVERTGLLLSEGTGEHFVRLLWLYPGHSMPVGEHQVGIVARALGCTPEEARVRLSAAAREGRPILRGAPLAVAEECKIAFDPYEPFAAEIEDRETSRSRSLPPPEAGL